LYTINQSITENFAPHIVASFANDRQFVFAWDVHEVAVQEIHIYADGSFNLLIRDSDKPSGLTEMLYEDFQSKEMRVGFSIGR
jgi:hypothetical protein